MFTFASDFEQSAKAAAKTMTGKGLYQQSAWYKFQESVKRYAELAETVLAIPLGLARQAME